MTSSLERLREAMQMQREGNFPPAKKIYQEVLEAEPENPDAIHLLGLIYGEEDDNDLAVSMIEKAISLSPNAAPFHHNIAGIYRRMGRLDDAEREFRRAIELKADYGEAYQGLAEMVKFKPGDPLLAKIETQLANPALPEGMPAFFNFAAGKINDDLGNYARAFRHYQAGNKATGKTFNTAEFRQQTKDTLYHYSREHVAATQGLGSGSDVPIFIVGMPRSGTSLAEQILASHSGVWGAGELNDMKFVARAAMNLSSIKGPYPVCVPGLPDRAYQQLGDMYVSSITNESSAGHQRIVDKHPLNFQFVGLILDMLPNARVIHTTRHPLDTCLSCFFQNFTKGQHYSFDLTALAEFYVDYRRMMSHLDMVYPGRILEVNYETLLGDLEDETRRMLDFCGLEFEDACLAFHETDRVVKTASFYQVRQPLYQSSRGRWQYYREELAPVAEILGIPMERPVTVLGSSSLLRGGGL